MGGLDGVRDRRRGRRGGARPGAAPPAGGRRRDRRHADAGRGRRVRPGQARRVGVDLKAGAPPEDPREALDAARDRLRARADALRDEIAGEGEGPPAEG